jgi:hypothetical protein
MDRIKTSAKDADTHCFLDNKLTGCRSQLQPFFGVQVQHLDGGASDGCLAGDYRASTLEMFAPQLASRTEQLGQLSRFRIVTCHITSFVQIAVDTSQREIVEVVAPAVFPRQNMLNMQGGQRRLVLMQSAILATEICPAANLASHGGIHAG